MNKADTERLEELKLKIFGIHAAGLMNKDQSDSPAILSSNDIESHGGRVKKAIRFLTEARYIYQVPKPNNRDTYGCYKYYQVTNFDTDSLCYADTTQFQDTWKELCSRVASRNSQANFDHIGYLDINRLSSRTKIYMYHHQDAFNLAQVGSETRIYPIAQEDDRQKAILRSCVELHLLTHYREKLEGILRLPAGSIFESPGMLRGQDQVERSNRVVNVYPESLKKKYFESKDGFLAEYNHSIEYLTRIRDLTKLIIEKVKAYGGYEAVIRDMRKQSIETLMREAPLFAVRKGKDDDESDETYRRYSAKFILSHVHFFDYDTLYGTDESVKHISKRGMYNSAKHVVSVAFEPYKFDEKETNFLKAMNKNMPQQTTMKLKSVPSKEGDTIKCLAKLISETLETTSKSS